MVDPFGNNNRQPSAARQQGRAAVAEAIQHHMDRLGPNKTKAVYSNPHPPQMMAAAPGAIKRAQAYNAAHPNQTFFTPAQQKWADRQQRRNDPLGRLGDKAEGFLQLKQLGQQLAQQFNPTTKAGAIGLASMFVGGPKGDATPMMESLGMKGQFENYGMESAKGMRFNPSTSRALERGVANEGPRNPNGTMRGAGIRGLVRRAQGVGGYRPANPLDVIEGKRAEQSQRLQEEDIDKNFVNGLGATQKSGRTDFQMRRAFEAKQRGQLEPYKMMGREAPFNDMQPHDYTDRMHALRIDAANPEAGFLPKGQPDAIRQALYDMIFKRKAPYGGRPQRPGPRPGEYPYGGGPFG